MGIIYWVCIRDEETGKLLESHPHSDYKKARKAADGINEEEWSTIVKIDVMPLDSDDRPH